MTKSKLPVVVVRNAFDRQYIKYQPGGGRRVTDPSLDRPINEMIADYLRGGGRLRNSSPMSPLSVDDAERILSESDVTRRDGFDPLIDGHEILKTGRQAKRDIEQHIAAERAKRKKAAEDAAGGDANAAKS